MTDREALEQRVAELEVQLAALKRMPGNRSGLRKRSATMIGRLPLYEVAIGPDVEHGQMRGHAKAIFAFGDVATGVVAAGGLARGIVAMGGLAVGAISFGGLSVGALVAIGGLAIGSAAVGGAAIGGVGVGGGAVGYYACGGGAAGKYVIDSRREDPQAVAFFRQNAPAGLCGPSYRMSGRWTHPPPPSSATEAGR